jgi:acyl-CoA synthetase (AMP-forming)/AMP-acid ligase II
VSGAGSSGGVCAEALEQGSEEDGYHLYYTSGTTGVPKGVMLSHKIVVSHAVGTIKEMNLNAADVWGHFAPMFHLVDVFAIYAITLVGGRHVILPTFTPQDALLAIERERVSAANVASTMIAMLVNNPLAEQLDLTSLRVLSCGGSPQSPAVVVRAIALFGCEFFLSYGMTECCGKISMSILPQGAPQRMPVGEQLALVTTSGRPFELIDVRVVGEDGQSVARGSNEVGEVWVHGPTVFNSYFGLPQATAEAFAEGGWFKTGDLATASANGYIQVRRAANMPCT